MPSASDDPADTSRELAQRLSGSQSHNEELDAAQFKAAAERQLLAFTRGLTEELCVRLRETAHADPKSPWLRYMLLAGRKVVP